MSVTNERLRIFFDHAMEALRAENTLLASAFARACHSGRGRYDVWSWGVPCLSEPTLVYLIVRQLLVSDFPFEIGWEYPYPGRASEKMDLEDVLALLLDKNEMRVTPRRADCRTVLRRTKAGFLRGRSWDAEPPADL